jgi:hypothetical protein
MAVHLFGQKMSGGAGERDEERGAASDEPRDERDGQHIKERDGKTRPGQIIDNALQDDEQQTERDEECF